MAEHIVIYALLDGESATGAFRFDLTPGQETFIDANVSLFARKADAGARACAALLDVFRRQGRPALSRRLPRRTA